MRTVKRIIVILLTIVAIIAVALMIPPSWPDADPTPSDLGSLSRRCEIVRDRLDVPHIKAESQEAGIYCWGLLHGRDRAWQLDYLRRIALGRLAERYGSKHARQDFFFRLLDLPGLASRWEERLKRNSKASHRLLRFYAWGVNRGLAQGVKRSYQLQSLGFDPAPWRVRDSLAIGLLQSFYQTRWTFTDDLRHAALRHKLGEKRYEELYGPAATSRLKPTTIIKHGEHRLAPQLGLRRNDVDGDASPETGAGGGEAGLLNAAIAFLDSSGSTAAEIRGMGSNNWVIGPARSATGHAMLANDPHLEITTPAFWYEAHLRVGELAVLGIGVPGLPTFAAGNNRHLAWGLTNGYGNAADVFKVEPDEQGRFRLGGKSFQRRSIRPVVRVKIGPLFVPVFWKSFHTSDLGPFLPIPGAKALLMRWTGFHAEEGTIRAALGLIEARTVKEAERHLRSWQLPSWNFVFADTKGGIGYRQVGLVAKRRVGVHGLVDGRDPKQQWQGFLSADEMPSLLDPARGFIATANNWTFPPASYPFFMGHGYAHGYRAERIEQLIQEKEKLTLDDMRRIQLDSRVPEAAHLLPTMLRVLTTSKRTLTPDQRRAVDLLGSWDLQARREAVAPTVFRLWADRLVRRVFAGLDPLPKYGALLRVLEGEIRPQGRVPVETLLHESLTAALNKLRADLGPDPKQWRWERYHRIPFRSLLDDRGDWSPGHHGMDGDDRTVNVASHGKSEGPFVVPYAASYRMVVELGPRQRSAGVLAGKQIDKEPKKLGQQQRLWLDGRYRPRPFYPDEVKEHKRSRSAEVVRF